MQTEITHLTILRHGETEWNIQGKHQGQLDSPLTALGVAQAKAAAAYLKNESYDLIYSSDLNRALTTAKLLNQHFKLQLITDSNIRERNLGLIQGLTINELQEQYPDIYQKYCCFDPDYIIPEGESARQCYQRVVAWMEAIGRRHSGQKLLIVTHGLILSNIMRKVLGIPLNVKRNFSLCNGSINRFTISRGEWKLETWGDISHTKQLQTADEMLGVNL